MASSSAIGQTFNNIANEMYWFVLIEMSRFSSSFVKRLKFRVKMMAQEVL